MNKSICSRCEHKEINIKRVASKHAYPCCHCGVLTFGEMFIDKTFEGAQKGTQNGT